MSWIAITEDIVKGSAGLTGPELSAVRTTALPTGVTDTLADVIERVTNEVRGRVAACQRNALGDGATIPEECLTAALARIVFELSLRIPRGVVLTDQRNKANDNALAFLRDVAKCEVAIVPPATEAETQAGGTGVQLVGSRDRVATREKMAGL